MLGGAGNGGGGPEEVLELAEEANASLTEFFAQQSVSADSSLVLTLLGMGVAMGECVDALLVMLDERERDRDNVGRGDWQKRNFERSSFEQRRGREGRDDGWEEETNRDQHRFRNREERHAESPPKSRKNFGKDEQISPSPQKRHFPNSTTPRSDFERTPQKSRGGRREIEMERGTPDRWGKERERDGRREVESPGQHSSETESPSERRMERSGRRVEKKEYAEREEKERKRGKWEEDERSREDKGGRDVGRRRNEQIERGRQGSGLKGEWRGSNEWEDSDENRRNKERQRGVIFDQKMADRQDEKKPQESRHSPHKHRHSNSPQDHTPQPSPPRRHDKHDSSQRNTPRHHPQEASRNQRTTPDKTLQNSLLRNSASISTDSVHSLRRKPLNLMANSESDSESTDGGIGIVRGRKDLQRQERQRSSPYAGKHS
ncbi:hypothetical protein BLNAU_17883 [Blattamonas nauphoetae]|uniref:Uncharacterized protein n=1 Tax=Blattamonas nauphoetae TaxID=2049346 RepID=A0ABQ9X6H0_9EUKA|nr:hypothetical protein BLNAU_17883 [Blattamonas nauphoetae]